LALEFISLKKATISLGKAIEVVSRKLLDKSVATEELDTIKAGVIQNFEFTYEQSWKLMKRWLEENVGSEETDGVPRKELFRLGLENGLITDIDNWMTFHRARNVSSHTYDQDTADEVFAAAVSFLPFAEDLLMRLEQKK